MKKINVAELLKNCPTDLELDSPMYDNLYFDKVEEDYRLPISCYTMYHGSKTSVFFTEFGSYNEHKTAKCVIFPKDKTTWESFVPPCQFKDGDIIVKNNFIAIISYVEPNGRIWYHCWYNIKYKDYKIKTDFGIGCINDDDKIRFATKEEKEKLFKAIKDNGYKWNPETKELEKLIQPKFKVGDWVVNKFGDVWHIDSFNSKNYQVSNGDKYCYFLIEEQDKMHLWTIDDAKDGDVLVCDINKAEIGGSVEKLPNIVSTIFNFKKVITSRDYIHSYFHLYDKRFLGLQSTMYYNSFVYNISPATKEQRDLLFTKIKEAGYEWNIETKTLEKLFELKFKVGDIIKSIGSDKYYIIKDIEFDRYILNNDCFLRFNDEHMFELVVEPKFKVGDKVRGKYTNSIYTISGITPTGYELTNGKTFTFNAEDCHELVTGKFNITTLKPFDKVLVRNTNNGRWRGQFYMSYDKNEEYPFECTYNCWMQCIPFEGNEYLLDKTDNCNDFYKIW